MMQSKSITPDESIALFVKEILLFKDDSNTPTSLPFFADGYQALCFSKRTLVCMCCRSINKCFYFLYGQTIYPIELVIQGSYSLICFQLYPFVLNSFFNLHAKDLNNDCFDLMRLQQFDAPATIDNLNAATDIEKRVSLITAFLFKIFEATRATPDYKIQQAIQFIINNNGNVNVQELNRALNINERTF